MNLYEHTIVTRQDTSAAEIKQLTEKYSKIVEKNDGEIVQTENWGLLNLSYIIKKNKKGSYIHLKIKGSGKIIKELEKNEILDKKLLRYMTVKVKKFDLEANYFSKKEEFEKKEYEKREYNRN
jgi:small subunit ribosomal protein S6